MLNEPMQTIETGDLMPSRSCLVTSVPKMGSALCEILYSPIDSVYRAQ